MGFANPLPWWAFLLVTAAAAALAWHAYRSLAGRPFRRHLLSSLRFVTLLALVVVLMRPVTRVSEIDARDVVVPILVDASRSMAIEDADGRRRIDAARAFLTDRLLPVLRDRFQVEVLTFGEKVAATAAADLNATARRSDLAGTMAAVRERYRGRPVAGYVMVTDGGDTGAALDLESYGEMLPPVYPVAMGSSDIGHDREVLSVTAAESVLDGSRLDLAVSAVVNGRVGERVELRLLENGRPVQVRHVRPSADGGPMREVFQISPPAGGAAIYTVEIPPAAKELVPENNSRSVLVQPPSRTRRVLVVEGAPGFEHSFLRRALAGDSGIEVDAVVRKGKNEQGQDTYYIQAAKGRGQMLASGYPPDTASLFTYDAIALANVAGDQLTNAQMEATREFVSRRGGGLVVLGAQSFLARGLAGTPVEDALPAELNRRIDTAVPASDARGVNRIALTDAGYAHPVTRLGTTPDEVRKRWEALPSLPAAVALGNTRAGAAVLATTAGTGGASRPLIAVQRYGEGRSMIFTGEGSWRWRMLLPSTDKSYETFWRQTVRWLALGAMDPVTVLPTTSVGPGDEMKIRAAIRDATFVTVPDADVTVSISGPDGRLQDLRASIDRGSGGDATLFAARFTPEQPGVYRVAVTARRGATTLGSASTSVLVGGADLEMADPRTNLPLLERIAAATGGRLIRPDQTTELANALRSSAPAAALAVQKDLWHNAWSLTALIALLAAEWILRRKWGLR